MPNEFVCDRRRRQLRRGSSSSCGIVGRRQDGWLRWGKRAHKKSMTETGRMWRNYFHLRLFWSLCICFSAAAAQQLPALLCATILPMIYLAVRGSPEIPVRLVDCGGGGVKRAGGYILWCIIDKKCLFWVGKEDLNIARLDELSLLVNIGREAVCGNRDKIHSKGKNGWHCWRICKVGI